MKLLLDTHILIWAGAEPERLRSRTRELLEEPANRLCFSVVSLWEIVIKGGDNRAGFSADAQRLRTYLLDNDYEELPITAAHTLAVRDLPSLHKDPFDRLLIAQATIEGLALITADKRMIAYGEPVVRA